VKQSYWEKRPFEFLGGLNVDKRATRLPYSPFDAGEIVRTLLTLPKLKHTTAVVRAARRYSSGMERSETQPETCYQLFISAAETMAGAALEAWEPETEVKIASKSGLVSYAMRRPPEA
jgi:hypothetical protein